MQELKEGPGAFQLDTLPAEIVKLERVNAIGLPTGLFEAAPQPIRVTLCHVRQAEITDGLVQLLIQLVHKISVRVAGKNGILVKFATAALALPEQIVRTAQSPCAGTLLP